MEPDRVYNDVNSKMLQKFITGCSINARRCRIDSVFAELALFFMSGSERVGGSEGRTLIFSETDGKKLKSSEAKLLQTLKHFEN